MKAKCSARIIRYYEVCKICQGPIIQDFVCKKIFEFNSEFNREPVKLS